MTADEKSKEKKDSTSHEPRVPAPDGGYGWVVLIASFVHKLSILTFAF
jgi:hypothetical protein